MQDSSKEKDRLPLVNLDEPLTDQLPQEIGELDLYQKREKIYTRKIEGFFQTIRVYTGWPLLVSYFILPWLEWRGQQLVLFDLPARKFYVFGITFWPQDFHLLAWVLIISAFLLFLVTKLFGRVWCGYTCPQTVWTSMFMWIEQRTEGTRNQRIKLDKQPWSAKKLVKKSLKHIMWLSLATFTAVTFVAYFTPADQLIFNLFTFSVAGWEFFWIAFFSLLTYINAGWLREQVCIYMCPYARFQSVMFDSDTLIVSYDAARGEPRGSRKKGIASKENLIGDCVDCQLCVQVCPTGIDIRDGLQYECIGCALCIDACNSIMKKMDYAPNLIKYTTEHQLNSASQRKSALIRPATVGYFSALLIMSGLLTYSLVTRTPLALDIIRDRNQLYREVGGNLIENSYTAKIMNMSEAEHSFDISLRGIEGASITEASSRGSGKISLTSGEILELPLRVTVTKANIRLPVTPITFLVKSTNNAELSAEQESRFIAPGGFSSLKTENN